MKKLFSLFALLLNMSSFASTKSDSLNRVWNDENQIDSIRCAALYDLIWEDFLYNDPDTAFKLSRELYFFSQKKRLPEWEYEAVHAQGLCCFYTDQYRKALNYYRRYLDYHLENRNAAKVAGAFHSIALTYVNIGDLVLGLENYRKSLKLKQELNDFSGQSKTLNNIGNIYYELEDFDKALDYYKRAYELKKKTNNKRAIGNSLNNIGLMLHELGNLDSALFYYKKSLEFYNEVDYVSGQIIIYTNVGALYEETGRLDSALLNFKICLHQSLEINSLLDAANSSSNIAGVLLAKNQLDSALFYSLQGLRFAREIQSINYMEQATKVSYEIYKQKGDGLKALEMHEEYILMRDSIKSAEAKRGIVEMEIKHEIEKEDLEDEQHEKEAELAALEKEERRNSLEYSAITMGLFLLFALVFLFGRFKLPNWAVEFSVFLPFLILFEFVLVLTDPYIEAFANNDPIIKLVVNACIAGLIFPAHSFFERILKREVFHR